MKKGGLWHSGNGRASSGNRMRQAPLTAVWRRQLPAMKVPEGTNLALKLAEVRAANERLKREAEPLKAAAAIAEAVKKAAVVAGGRPGW